MEEITLQLDMIIKLMSVGILAFVVSGIVITAVIIMKE